jgi:hypothetical protein
MTERTSQAENVSTIDTAHSSGQWHSKFTTIKFTFLCNNKVKQSHGSKRKVRQEDILRINKE